MLRCTAQPALPPELRAVLIQLSAAGKSLSCGLKSCISGRMRLYVFRRFFRLLGRKKPICRRIAAAAIYE
jgi:hypothetical protein